MQGLPLFLGVFAALAAAHDGRAQTVVHPLAGETLAVRAASVCGKVGSVDGPNRVTKLSFVPRGIALDLVSPASKKIKLIFADTVIGGPQ